jgi:hypothetical protein
MKNQVVINFHEYETIHGQYALIYTQLFSFLLYALGFFWNVDVNFGVMFNVNFVALVKSSLW